MNNVEEWVNIRPKTQEDCEAWVERCGKCGKKNRFAKAFRQKATTKLRQLEYSEESHSNESIYITQEEVANFETKKSDVWRLYWWKPKAVNVSWNMKLKMVHHAMWFHIHSSVNWSKMGIPKFNKVSWNCKYMMDHGWYHMV